MRIIKLGIISLVFFSLLVTVISLFFPSHIRISKAVDINAPKDSVMSQVKDLSNWKKWYPGADTMDLGGITISGSTDSTVTASINGAKMQKAFTGWNFYPSAMPNTVTIQWYMDFHLHWYPWEKFSSLLLEGRYGPMMEKGLTNLKTLVEK